MVYDPDPILFFLFLSFFFFGLLMARASPGSTIVNDPLFVCDFAYSISSRNRCRFARFFLSWTILSQHHVYDGNIDFHHVWMYWSLMFCSSEGIVCRRLFHSFLGVLTPSNLERARINFGSYCRNGAPPIDKIIIIVWALYTVAFLSLF